MKQRSAREVDAADIQAMLGQVELPGTANDFLDALQRPWGNVMRRRRDVDPRELTIASEGIHWYQLGLRPTTNSPRPSRTLAYASGDYFVQDAGSLLALSAAQADTTALAGKLICDLCAAPGGKATALVEAISGDDDESFESSTQGFVLANEVIRSRLGALQLNLARTGSDRYAISSLDPEVLANRLPGVFDVVLVDAPCSGQAMMARGKQKRSSFSISQIEHSASRQRRILDAARRLLREDGCLVYSTCTFAEAENEAQINQLIAHSLCEADDLEHLEPYRSGPGCYRLWPHLHSCAGSFAARLRITATTSGGTPGVAKRFANTSKPDGRAFAAESHREASWRSWLDLSDTSLRLWQNDSILVGWPADAPPWVESIASSGPELAHRTGQTWKPAHAAALRRIHRGRAANRMEVEPELAQRYLRGETIPVPFDGWFVATCRGRPLGWIKGSGGIGKNHLPTSARFTGILAI